MCLWPLSNSGDQPFGWLLTHKIPRLNLNFEVTSEAGYQNEVKGLKIKLFIPTVQVKYWAVLYNNKYVNKRK